MLPRRVLVGLDVRQPKVHPGISLVPLVRVVARVAGRKVPYADGVVGGLSEKVSGLVVVVLAPGLGPKQRNGAIEGQRCVPVDVPRTLQVILHIILLLIMTPSK